MTEVIGIKFEETGAVEYVVPDKNYSKDDFVVVLEKKDTRLAQVVMENTDFPELSLPADLNRVEGLAGEKDFARYEENLLKAEKSMGVVAELIAQNQLDMKVVDIVFPLNNSYVLISFVADRLTAPKRNYPNIPLIRRCLPKRIVFPTTATAALSAKWI